MRYYYIKPVKESDLWPMIVVLMVAVFIWRLDWILSQILLWANEVTR